MDAQIVNFQKYYDEFINFTSDIDDSVPRGILKSEAFFVRGLIADSNPVQLIESGRAQGQSTLLLSKSMPQLKIISIEREFNDNDSSIALDRLSAQKNVNCLFGDSKKILPHLALDGDVVIIDGPKDMDAMLLLHKICQKRKISQAFIHDAYHGSLLRSWLEVFRKNVVYSDDSHFLIKYCHVDKQKSDKELKFWSDPKSYPTKKVYGGTFVCFDVDDLNFNLFEYFSLKIYRIFSKYKRSLLKRIFCDYKDKHPCEA